MDPTTLIVTAVNNGTALSNVSDQLRQAGYTTAQILQLYNQVAASSVATPQILQYLQAENSRLQSDQKTQNLLFLAVFAIGGYMLLNRRNSR